MKSRLPKYISFGALSVVVATLIAATLIEKQQGTPFVLENIYHSYAFIALWGVLAISATIHILRSSAKVISPTLLLHMPFVVILTGALVSFITSKRGEMYISQHSPPASMFELASGEPERLPFRIELESFTANKEGGSTVDYTMTIAVTGKDGKRTTESISMNNPMQREGYAIYIDGYSADTVSLLVSYDPWGCTITYTGYTMLLIGIIMFLACRNTGLRATINRFKGLQGKEESKAGAAGKAVAAVAAVLLAYLSWAGISHWVETLRFPAANGYETMLLLAWCALLAGLVLYRRSATIMYSSFAIALVALVIAAITGGNPGSEIAPILRTPLLAIHVIVIIISYALIGSTALISTVALWHICHKNSDKAERLAVVGRLLLYPALFLLVIGVFIGSIWANLSWGRYWGWDPKEVWALITVLMCSIPLHSRSLPALSKPLYFHIFCIVSFMAMLFTYLGTNWFLGGMHSYL